MLIRTNAGRIYRSDSMDYGRSWCKAYKTSLPNNNSGIDCVKDNGGRLWLMYNPVSRNRGARNPLTLAVSGDNGIIWEKYKDMEARPGEFSYPAITFLNGMLHITYTYSRKQIVYRRIEI